jgi:hypothetical protein
MKMRRKAETEGLVMNTMRDLKVDELESVSGGDLGDIGTAIAMIGHGLWVVTDVIRCGPDPCSPLPSGGCTPGQLCA